MKKVISDICNSLMSASISNILCKTGEFDVQQVCAEDTGVVEKCRTSGADIAVLEVAYNPGFTMDERMNAVSGLHREVPGCKVLLLCDENSSPELARKIATAKRDRMIDDFVYSSVSESFLVAMMEAI